MTSPMIGQIYWVGFNFVPNGFVPCDGRTMSITQNQALFSLLGTYYGGNGVTTFGVPDLRGRLPLGWGTDQGISYTIGQVAGTEGVPLTEGQLPAHVHTLPLSDRRAATGDPGAASGGTTFAGGASAYAPAGQANAQFHPSAIANAGGSQPHPNMQPYLVLNAIIATQGIYPSRN